MMVTFNLRSCFILFLLLCTFTLILIDGAPALGDDQLQKKTNSTKITAPAADRSNFSQRAAVIACPPGSKRDRKGKCRVVVVIDYEEE